MNRWLKGILILAGVVILLMILAAVALPRIFDSENLKARIVATVNEQTGRELRIEGDLEFSVFPLLALEVNRLSLGNAPGFGDVPFAEIERARAGIAVLPLLRQDIQTEEIVLDGLRLNLTIDENGASNWGDLGSDRSPAPPPEVSQHVPYRTPRIAGVNISDALIDFHDQQAGVHYRLSGFSLKSGPLGTARAVPLEMAMVLEDLEAKSRVEIELAADAEFDAELKTLFLPNLEMQLDDTRVAGELAVVVQDAALPAFRFDLDMDRLDLDRYLSSGGSAGTADTDDDVDIPKEELAGLDVEGSLRIASLLAMGVTLDDAELGVRLKDSILHLDPMYAGFYGGEYRGDITLNAAGKTPQLSLNQSLTSVTFDQLAADLLGNDRLSGSAFVNLQAAGGGSTQRALLNDLTGQVELRLDEGALEGVDIWYEIRKAMALFKGRPVPGDDQGRTVFSRMNVDGILGGGALQLQNIQAELPFLEVAGTGNVDLNSTALDISLVAGISRTPELDEDPLAAELEGRSVPFTIKGTADKPDIKVDIENLIKGEATRRLMDRLGLDQSEETAESEEDATEQAVKGILGGLLGRKKKDDDEKDDDSN